MNDRFATFLCIFYNEPPGIGLDFAGIANLTPTFCIEGRCFQHDKTVLTLRKLALLPVVTHCSQN